MIFFHLWRIGFSKKLSDVEIKAIGDLSVKDWMRHENKVKEALRDIVPELQTHYERIVKTKCILRNNSEKARQAYKNQSVMRKATEKSKKHDSAEDCALPTFTAIKPVDDTYNPLVTDVAKRNEILSQRKNKPGKTFTDQ